MANPWRWRPPLNLNSACASGLACAVILAGCAAHRVTPEPPAPDNTGYIDLKAGWKLRVVTPILKSGGYQLRTTSAETSGNSITASAQDFLGFETAYYSVDGLAGGYIRIEFQSAIVTKGEASTPQPRPMVLLFDLPAGVRFARLIYLTRVSESDHDMAVVASDQKETLDALTRAVQSNPGNCASDGRVFCSWVPAGISVRPEF